MKKLVLQDLVLVVVFSFLLGLLFFIDGKLIGFAIFSDFTQSDFDGGTYINTTYNGSSVTLTGNNLTGNFRSKIFDAGGMTNWHNVSWLGNEISNVSILLGIDGGGNIYSSNNSGINWITATTNYAGTINAREMFSSFRDLYIISKSNRAIWKSSDEGKTWNIVNDTFANNKLLVGESDFNGRIYVIDASGDVYISSDGGVTWNLQGDFNNAKTNDAKGLGINSSNSLFVVDAKGTVFSSNDLGVSWVQRTANYGGGSNINDLETDSFGNLYILFNKAVYKSSDFGISWNIISSSFTTYSDNGRVMFIDSNDLFFIADAIGRIFVSQNYGFSWVEQGDLNGGANKKSQGLATLNENSALKFRVRSCALPDCSDGIFGGPYGSYEFLNNSVDEKRYNSNGTNMSVNYLLMHLNELSGNPIDSSGKGNSVSLVRGIKYSSNGKFSNSLEFNGINGTIDLVYNDTNFNFSRKGALTVATWIKPKGLHQGGDSEIISQYKSSTKNRVWSLHIRNNVTRFVACGNGMLSSCIYATGTTKINLNKWYYVVGRWNGNNVDVYVNGLPEDFQQDILTKLHSTNEIGIRIGRDVSIIGNGYFNGSIDEVSVWGRALSDEEILNSYKKGENNFYESGFANLSLQENNYFQYLADFTRGTAGITPYLNRINISYSLVSQAPVINIISPANTNSFSAASNISLNFTVSDANGNLDSCWYNLDGGINTSLVGCGNTIFNAGVGSHILNVYANDSSNLQTRDFVSFNVINVAPIVKILSPFMGELVINNNSVELNFTVSDVDGNLDSCWYNLDGGINTSLVGCGNISLGVLGDKIHNLTLFANDTNGLSSKDSVSFIVDNAGIIVSINEPSGTKSSRTGINLIYLVSGINASCSYRVDTSIGSEIIGNTTLSDCNPTQFNVSNDGDYVITVFANNSLGSTSSDSLSFTIDTTKIVSSPPRGGGSSSGGSSSGGISQSKNTSEIISLDISKMKDVVLKRGSKKRLEMKIINKEKTFLNDCKLIFEGTAGKWLNSNQSTGLASGQKYLYYIDLDVSVDVDPGAYSAQVIVQCDEGSDTTGFVVNVYRNAFEVKFIGYDRIDGKLVIRYNIEEFSGEEHKIKNEFDLLDFDGVSRYKGEEIIKLGAKESEERMLKFELPKDTFGEFSFSMDLSDGLNADSLVADIFLPSGKGTLGGLAISDGKNKNLSLVGVILIGVLTIFFIGRFIYTRHKRKKKFNSIPKKRKKHLLEFDL